MVGKFALRNLSKCLDQEWEIPFDVSITVTSTEGKSVHVNAHKAILAMSSKVFKERDIQGYLYMSLYILPTLNVLKINFDKIKGAELFCDEVVRAYKNK